MSAQPSAVELPEVSQLWNQWTVIVEPFGRGGNREAQPIAPEQYQALHAALLHGCLLKAAIADQASRLSILELYAAIEPWNNIAMLEHAHRDVATSLLAVCNELGAAVGWRRRRLSLAARLAFPTL